MRVGPVHYGDARYDTRYDAPARGLFAGGVQRLGPRGGRRRRARSRRTSGGGAIAGAIVGGVLGHQIGSGRGNDAATVAGAVGGALAGNEIERRRNADEQYRVTVQFRDGREASFIQDSPPGLRVGDRVRVADNRLYRD
jgi:outer membrane lipoprotein SlyB